MQGCVLLQVAMATLVTASLSIQITFKRKQNVWIAMGVQIWSKIITPSRLSILCNERSFKVTHLQPSKDVSESDMRTHCTFPRLPDLHNTLPLKTSSPSCFQESDMPRTWLLRTSTLTCCSKGCSRSCSNKEAEEGRQGMQVCTKPYQQSLPLLARKIHTFVSTSCHLCTAESDRTTDRYKSLHNKNSCWCSACLPWQLSENSVISVSKTLTCSK